ncbi:hypothetical protein JW935_20325 [candidate division KSB1 bacterium]|nr:hypothetical protein [candidate division KSB1 bacterium]
MIDFERLLEILDHITSEPLVAIPIVVILIILTVVTWYLKSYLTEKARQRAKRSNIFETNPNGQHKQTERSTREKSDLTKSVKPNETIIRFQSTFDVDPVSIKCAIDQFVKNAEFIRVEWPKECNDLCELIHFLFKDAKNYTKEGSIFYKLSPTFVRSFMDSNENHRTLPIHYGKIESRIPYLLEEVNNCKILIPFKDQVLTNFLKSANYFLHIQIATSLLKFRPLPPSVRHRVPESWREIVQEVQGTEGALSRIMGWNPPVLRQNVIELSGQHINHYFYIPMQYCKNAFSVKERGFVECIVPQYEYSLALVNSIQIISYDGVVKSSKTIDADGMNWSGPLKSPLR